MATEQMGTQYTEQVQAVHKQKFPRLNRFMDRCGNFLLNYWATLITILLGLLVLTAISIPFLSYFGLDSIAKPLFFSLHYVCAQIPSHSFYILGHQLGLCARNLSIYSSMFLGSLIFTLSKKRVPGIPWWLWVLMILPMALDGTTQMFGWRERTWILRTVTGTLVGLGSRRIVHPLIHKTLLEDLAHAALPPLRKNPTYPTGQEYAIIDCNE